MSEYTKQLLGSCSIDDAFDPWLASTREAAAEAAKHYRRSVPMCNGLFNEIDGAKPSSKPAAPTHAHDMGGELVVGVLDPRGCGICRVSGNVWLGIDPGVPGSERAVVHVGDQSIEIEPLELDASAVEWQAYQDKIQNAFASLGVPRGKLFDLTCAAAAAVPGIESEPDPLANPAKRAAYYGLAAPAEAERPTMVRCDECQGTGGDSQAGQCGECRGSGSVRRMLRKADEAMVYRDYEGRWSDEKRGGGMAR